MPRKPKAAEKQTVTVVINSVPVAVILHPPVGTRTCWYAYWSGLVSSKSTGHPQLADAVAAVDSMVRDWKAGGDGGRPRLSDAFLSDEEFETVQRIHFTRKQDVRERHRAEASLKSCLEAIAAFRDITGLPRVTLATPDDCAQFQRTALDLPKGWRRLPVDKKHSVDFYGAERRATRERAGQSDALDGLPRYSPNNILRWSRTLQASFERVNRNATKRKCVRGVVDEAKLLTSNPWSQFVWTGDAPKPIRQFDASELLAFLDHFETAWDGVCVVRALAKVLLWSSGRRLETASLSWDALRVIGNEYHFEMTGKWGIEKWFRVPEGLYRDLAALRSDSPFVFAAYPAQLQRFYERAGRLALARKVRADFDPENVAEWLYKKIKAWSQSLPMGYATTHIFRKTSLQYARSGEDVNRQVARDARVSESVMMTNYVEESDPERRAMSNRTFERIRASLPPAVACRYGYVEAVPSTLEQQIQGAVAAKDWALAATLTARLAAESRQDAG